MLTTHTQTPTTQTISTCKQRRRHFWSSIGICVSFCLLDGLITTIALGLYHGAGMVGGQQPLFHVNASELWDHLTLQDGYSFVRAPFDFIPLFIFRSLLLIVLLLLRFFTRIKFSNNIGNNEFIASEIDTSKLEHSTTKPDRLIFFTLVGIEICNFSYSLIKLLAFSDVPEQLGFPGMWINVLWNILAFLTVYAIYQFWLFKQKSSTTTLQVLPSNERNQSINNADADMQVAAVYQPLLNNDSGATTTNTTDTSANSIVVDENSSTSSSETSTPISIEQTQQQPNQQQETKITTWAHIRCLLRYCAYYWGWLAIGFVFLIIYSAARVIVPMYTARVISNIVGTRDMNVFFQSIFWQSMLMIIVVIFNGLQGGTMNYTTALIERRMRQDLFRSVTNQEIAFFDRAQTGEILSRLIADCETMSSTVSHNVNILLRNGVMVVGSFALMIGMSWRLTMVTVIIIPPIAFFTKLYSAYYDRLSSHTQECKANANRVAEEVVSSMRNVRAFASECKEQRRFDQHLDQTLDVQKKKSFALAGFQWMTEAANNAILVAILSYGGYLVLSGRMTTDQMFAFLLYQLQLGENFYMLNSVATGLMESVGASRKVFEYLQRVPKIPLDRGKLRPAEVNGKVEFCHVSFAYPTRPNTRVLRDISFTIRPGEMIALVGPSGAGKSSVIALLEHFYEPLYGQILLDDRPIQEYEHIYLHQKISLVSQEPTLYACSIRENILYGCDEDKYRMHDVVEAAKQANIHQFVTDSESGYETKCGERGVQMSGGQKQRIAIARALIRQPAVLILDEATSALDAESEHVIQEALLRCTQGRTVLLIAHRLSTVERADRIIVLEAGQIVQIGNHAELMAQPDGLYHQLVKRQLLGETSSAQTSSDGADQREQQQQRRRGHPQQQKRQHRQSTP